MGLNAERLTWSFTQGDDYSRTWTLASSTKVRTLNTLKVQLRNKVTGALVASSKSSEQVDGVLAIDTTGTDLTSPNLTFKWRIAGTSSIPAGTDYVLEAQVVTDGNLETFLSHSIEVRPQYAEGTA